MGKIISDEILNHQETRPKYTNKLHKNKTLPVNNKKKTKKQSIALKRPSTEKKKLFANYLSDTGCIYVDI